jgi:hypothetical protein
MSGDVLFYSVPSIVPMYLIYFNMLYNARHFVAFRTSLFVYTPWVFLEVTFNLLWTVCSDSESGGNTGEAVKTDRTTPGCEEAVFVWHDITLQQQSWEPAHSSADVCVAGMHSLLCKVDTVCTVTMSVVNNVVLRFVLLFISPPPPDHNVWDLFTFCDLSSIIKCCPPAYHVNHHRYHLQQNYRLVRSLWTLLFCWLCSPACFRQSWQKQGRWFGWLYYITENTNKCTVWAVFIETIALSDIKQGTITEANMTQMYRK